MVKLDNDVCVLKRDPVAEEESDEGEHASQNAS